MDTMIGVKRFGVGAFTRMGTLAKDARDDCFVCRVYLRSIEHLDAILSKVSERAATSTAIVKSTLVVRRLAPLV